MAGHDGDGGTVDVVVVDPTLDAACQDLTATPAEGDGDDNERDVAGAAKEVAGASAGADADEGPPDSPESGSVLAALDRESAIATIPVASLDQVLTELDRDAIAGVVIRGEGADYVRLRSSWPTVPAVLVADAVDRETLETIVGDEWADHVDPGAIETALVVRLTRLLDRAATSSMTPATDVTTEAIVEFDLETGALLDANVTFYDRWGWSEDELANATVADLRATDITYEHRGRGRGDESEEGLTWIRRDDPIDSMFDNAIGNQYETREWHCVDSDGHGFKATVRVVTNADDPGARRGGESDPAASMAQGADASSGAPTDDTVERAAERAGTGR